MISGSLKENEDADIQFGTVTRFTVVRTAGRMDADSERLILLSSLYDRRVSAKI